MELLTPLSTYIADKTLSEEEVIKLGTDICTALELCARRNIIHRDIKPENIFVNQFGDFKLGDFGIARKLENMTGVMSQKGTYSYMAPEIEKGEQYDATVDLYSLGLVLYRFTNKNRLPFLYTERQLLSPSERMESVRRRMSGEPLPAPCDASPMMAKIILCACQPNPADRFSIAAPLQPGNLQAVSHGSNSAMISWNASSGAKSYEVQYYSRTNGTWQSDPDYSSGTSYVSSGLSYYDTYEYRIRAVNSYGAASGWTEITYYNPEFYADQ